MFSLFITLFFHFLLALTGLDSAVTLIVLTCLDRSPRSTELFLFYYLVFSTLLALTGLDSAVTLIALTCLDRSPRNTEGFLFYYSDLL